jgi:hypothetical protein
VGIHKDEDGGRILLEEGNENMMKNTLDDRARSVRVSSAQYPPR